MWLPTSRSWEGPRRHVLAKRSHQAGPPHPELAREVGALAAVAHRVIGPQRGEAAVAHGDQRPLALRREAHLDQRLFVRLEVDAAPLEREPRSRLPGGDAPDLEGALVERFEEPSAGSFLEVDLAAPAAGNAVSRPLPPPEIDLAGEHLEGVGRRDRDVAGDARRVTAHVASRACAPRTP